MVQIYQNYLSSDLTDDNFEMVPIYPETSRITPYLKSCHNCQGLASVTQQ